MAATRPEYEASPDGDNVRIYQPQAGDGFTEVRPGRFVRVVHTGDVDDLMYVRTTCTWQGEPFIVLGEADGWLRVEYTGGKAPIAKRSAWRSSTSASTRAGPRCPRSPTFARAASEAQATSPSGGSRT